MTDSIPIPVSKIGASAVPRVGASSKKSEVGEAGTHAFKALLDQLDERAKALDVESRKDLTKDDLAGAIDNARTSLEQMLSLKEQLLEAWRAASTQAGDGASPRS